MGSMAEGAIRCWSWGMPPNILMEFNSTAAEAPNRLLVLPVTRVPSLSSMAAAGAWIRLARSMQGAMTRRIPVLILACFISSSSL